jgi:hypothetical protein
MITFFSVSKADTAGVQFVIRGDGVSTTLRVSLSKPPFNIAYGGVLPVSFEAVVGTDPGIVKINSTQIANDPLNGDVLTVVFSAAPPAGVTFGLNLSAAFNALP